MTGGRIGILLLATTPLAGCAGVGDGGFGSGYSLVRPGQVTNVGNGRMAVSVPHEWNRASRYFFDGVRQSEDWTLNGPYLDGITFLTGLPDGKALVRQSRHDDQQVPKFRSAMTASEIAAMLESALRVKGGAIDFTMTGLKPRLFLGTAGFQLDYEHLDTDELRRRGRAVGAVIDGTLFLVLLDAAKSHYFDAALPDFEAIVTSARRSR